MTGLDKIIAEISSESDSICAGIKSNTDKKCEVLLNEASKKSDEIKINGELKAKKIYDEILLRAKSTAELEKRSVLLRTKQEVISTALENARLYLCNLPLEDYFSLVYKMIAKYSEKSDGVICFSKKDLERLPDDFDKRLKENSKGNLSISPNAVDIDGGFILIYGSIEINCAFSSVFMAESELFSDEISAILFS